MTARLNLYPPLFGVPFVLFVDLPVAAFSSDAVFIMRSFSMHTICTLPSTLAQSSCQFLLIL